jgi:putative salt-induced outer membrane protein YdiY
MIRIFSQALVAFFILSATHLAADEIIMKNGSRIIGTVTTSLDGEIAVETDFAGTLTLAGDDIASLVTDHPVTLLMNDGRVYENSMIAVTQESMIITSGENDALTIALADFDKINPAAWELGNGYKFTGEVGVALLVEGGNTDNEELDVNYEITWRSLTNRYSSRGYYEFDESNSVKNKDKFRMVNKYDRFRDGSTENYYGALLAFEGDEFANNDLRTFLGPYIGRKFFDSTLLDLEGELGLVYVLETYIDDTEDYDYPGANWSLRISSDWISNYLGENSTLYVDHDGIANFDDAEALILNTTFGFSAPVYGGIEFGADLRFEYDGGVTNDVENTDTTFNFRLGYAW